MVTAAAAALTGAATAYDIAAATPDPELPQLTIADLGILRRVEQRAGRVVVTITPTYSGCPALRGIRADITGRLHAAGHHDVEIRTQLAPVWTSDWITADGRRKLTAAGIAAPAPAPARTGPVPLTLAPTGPATRCPRCGSSQTVRTASFSGTACKALHRCTACAEPFESMKAI